MSNNMLKLPLAQVGKNQSDLLPELRARGFTNLSDCLLSKYANGRDTGPQSKKVLAAAYEIIEGWRKETA